MLFKSNKMNRKKWINVSVIRNIKQHYYTLSVQKNNQPNIISDSQVRIYCKCYTMTKSYLTISMCQLDRITKKITQSVYQR